jgi:hypothetical protein
VADAPAPKKGKGKKTPKNTKIIMIAVGGALGVFALYKVYEDYKANNSAATTTATPLDTTADPTGTGGTGGTDPNATTTASSTPLSEAGWIESAVSALTSAGIDPTDAYNSILDWLNGEPISDPAAATALGTFLSSGGGLNSLPSGLNINPITTSTSGSSTPTTSSTGATFSGSNATASAEQDTNAAVVNQDGTVDTAAVKALNTASKNLRAAIAKGESAAKITALSDNVTKAQNVVNQRDAAAQGNYSAPTGSGTLTLLKSAQAAITKITAKAATVAPKVVAPVAAPKAAAPAAVAVKAPSQKASAAKVVKIPVQAKKA